MAEDLQITEGRMDVASPSSPPPSYDTLSASPVGAGLLNLGNTCFVNAVLQCVAHTVPLIKALRSSDHRSQCEREDFCVLCAVSDHIELALSSSKGVVSPRNLVENLCCASSAFSRYEQGDAHEFLNWLLDGLHSSLPYLKPADGSFLHEDHDSFVKQIFGGCLRSQIRCCNCGHRSDTFESLLDLSLEIDGAGSITDALSLFTKIEPIDDPDVKFSCDNCKQEVAVEKQLTLDRMPNIAAFHLKRFRNNGSDVEKISNFVEYPLELDMQPFLSSTMGGDNNCKYDLYAIVVHAGDSSRYGHYFSFCRSSPDSWYRLDDSLVESASKTLALTQEAYILFYKRHDSPWFSGSIEVKTDTQNKQSDMNAAIASPQSVLNDDDDVGAPLDSCSTSSSCSDDNGSPEAMDLFPATPMPALKPNHIEEPEETFKIIRPRFDIEDENLSPLKQPVVKPPPSIKTPSSLEDQRKAESVKRLISRMPSSRRSSLMACISPAGGGSLSDSLERKTKRIKLSMPPSVPSARGVVHRSENTRSNSYQSISPQAIKRACAAGGSHLNIGFE